MSLSGDFTISCFDYAHSHSGRFGRIHIGKLSLVFVLCALWLFPLNVKIDNVNAPDLYSSSPSTSFRCVLMPAMQRQQKTETLVDSGPGLIPKHLIA